MHGIGTILIRPTSEKAFLGMFGDSPTGVDAADISSTTPKDLHNVDLLGSEGQGIAALTESISKFPADTLVVVIGHNKNERNRLESPILALPNGQAIPASDLYAIGQKTGRKILLICCWNVDAGIEFCTHLSTSPKHDQGGPDSC